MKKISPLSKAVDGFVCQLPYQFFIQKSSISTCIHQPATHRNFSSLYFQQMWSKHQLLSFTLFLRRLSPPPPKSDEFSTSDLCFVFEILRSSFLIHFTKLSFLISFMSVAWSSFGILEKPRFLGATPNALVWLVLSQLPNFFPSIPHRASSCTQLLLLFSFIFSLCPRVLIISIFFEHFISIIFFFPTFFLPLL